MMCSKKALVGTVWCRWSPRVLTWVLTRVLARVLARVLTQVAAGHHWALLGAAARCLALLGTTGHICANFATCSWEPLTMLNPHFVAGEHGLFGGHKSEDIRTFFIARSTDIGKHLSWCYAVEQSLSKI